MTGYRPEVWSLAALRELPPDEMPGTAGVQFAGGMLDGQIRQFSDDRRRRLFHSLLWYLSKVGGLCVYRFHTDRATERSSQPGVLPKRTTTTEGTADVE